MTRCKNSHIIYQVAPCFFLGFIALERKRRCRLSVAKRSAQPQRCPSSHPSGSLRTVPCCCSNTRYSLAAYVPPRSE